MTSHEPLTVADWRSLVACRESASGRGEQHIYLWRPSPGDLDAVASLLDRGLISGDIQHGISAPNSCVVMDVAIHGYRLTQAGRTLIGEVERAVLDLTGFFAALFPLEVVA